MTIRTLILAALCLLPLTGCSTSAGFKLPPDTSLLIKGERAVFETPPGPHGYPVVKTRPFFWDAVVDINYSLVKNDKIVKEGKLPAQFRVVSIFWPPYAMIYWPFGFRLQCYDLTKDFVEECIPAAGRPPEISGAGSRPASVTERSPRFSGNLAEDS